jgi:asparagine synthase (glutamine-hydrolysing)
MCGISGFLDTARRCGEQELRSTVLRMVNTLHHRGPDDVGAWADAGSGVALGHRRLSILDLSSQGHQPMHSMCGRYVISFNGEVYNFRALRSELENLGYAFRGHSDTEVMLSCFSHWGVPSAVKRFNGMFAFALWDRQERVIHLVRDRMGEKPLYYGWIGKTFAFASELKALKAHPDFDREQNRDALTLYFRYNYIPAPYSIYQGISKALPGTIVTIAQAEAGCTPTVTPYWSVRAAVEQGTTNPFTGSEAEALGHLDTLLRDAVKIRMEADVPLGAFLSGGIDSSTIVSLMQAQSDRPVQTFTIGFHEAKYNEADHAKAIARHLGTEHTELYVTPQEAMAVIPRLPSLYDEPFSDSSQIPAFLISQLARRDVTVSLSGDGGDELFAGYDRYLRGSGIWQKIRRVPKSIRALVSHSLALLTPHQWNAVIGPIAHLLPGDIVRHNLGEKISRAAQVLTAEDAEALHLQLVSHWQDPASLVIGGEEPPTVLTDARQWLPLEAFESRMMYVDSLSYLPDDILVKVDRASMGVSLEARVPFLDHRVVEFSWRLPLALNIRNGRGKWLLRQVLQQYIPQSLTDRPKMGFAVPIDVWLRGPLREWAEALLDEKRLRDQGFFYPDPIREKWNEQLSGTSSWEHHLWDVLMFQAWLEHESQLP